jgi:hypothetical protein
MAMVFISHAEEDQALALEIASGLERAGYSTWYYERDSGPGLSYLLQVHRAIEACRFVVLVISPQALTSSQLTAEVVRAHETGKSFVPVRVGISHEEFQRRQPEWNMAVGAAASIAVSPGGAPAILPRIVEGLELLAAQREGRDALSTPGLPEPSRRPARTWAIAAGSVLALALVLLAVYGSLGGGATPPAGDGPPERAVRNTPSVPAPSSAPVPAPTPPRAEAAPAGVTRREPDTTPGPRCEERRPGFQNVHERGRLEVRDDLNEHTYAFVICEEHDVAKDTFVMRIVSSSVTGTVWSDETATRKAEDMERRAVECEPTGTAPVRSTGRNDQRSVVYVLCQAGGKPTSIEIHATTLRADASPYPLKVLRAAWPR